MGKIVNNIVLQTTDRKDWHMPLCKKDPFNHKKKLEDKVNSLVKQLINTPEFNRCRKDLDLYDEQEIDIVFKRDSFTIITDRQSFKYTNLTGIPAKIVDKANKIYRECMDHRHTHHSPRIKNAYIQIDEPRSPFDSTSFPSVSSSSKKKFSDGYISEFDDDNSMSEPISHKHKPKHKHHSKHNSNPKPSFNNGHSSKFSPIESDQESSSYDLNSNDLLKLLPSVPFSSFDDSSSDNAESENSNLESLSISSKNNEQSDNNTNNIENNYNFNYDNFDVSENESEDEFTPIDLSNLMKEIEEEKKKIDLEKKQINKKKQNSNNFNKISNNNNELSDEEKNINKPSSINLQLQDPISIHPDINKKENNQQNIVLPSITISNKQKTKNKQLNKNIKTSKFNDKKIKKEQPSFNNEQYFFEKKLKMNKELLSIDVNKIQKNGHTFEYYDQNGKQIKDNKGLPVISKNLAILKPKYKNETSKNSKEAINTPENNWQWEEGSKSSKDSSFSRSMNNLYKMKEKREKLKPKLENNNPEIKKEGLKEMTKVLDSYDFPKFGADIITAEQLLKEELKKTQMYAKANNTENAASETKKKLQNLEEIGTMVSELKSDLLKDINDIQHYGITI